jgi:Tfp pilus assembly pilus retraction ATPase PilT
MQTMNAALANLAQRRLITKAVALESTTDKEDLLRMLSQPQPVGVA